MKRFTETSKWSDPWYRKLSTPAKLLWGWMLDYCDDAGIIEPDWDLATFQIGVPMGMDTLLEFGDRVVKLPCGKYHIPKFITFQYGELSRECKAHNPIFLSLEKHGILGQVGVLKGYPKGIDTLQEKEKEKEKEGVKGESDPSKHEQEILAHLNSKSDRKFRATEVNLRLIRSRLAESGVDVAGIKKMIERQVGRWKGDPKMEEYLRPETLFGKTKFDGYYAAKDAPAIALAQPKPWSCMTEEEILQKAMR